MTVRLIQVTNVSTSCQKDQLRSLFANLGRIEDLQLYPDSETLIASVGAKVAYIKFDKSELAHAALQLTNTVFIERALICSLVRNGKIPDETEAVQFCAPLNANIMLIPGGATWPNTVINKVVGTGPGSVIETTDPALTERSLPQYPPLPGSMDPIKAEEIRRTVYVSNISNHVSLENINDLFCQVGEVRYIRFAGDENAQVKGAYVEFSEQPHIVRALCINGLQFAGRALKVNHATNAIIKPTTDKQVFVDQIKRSTSRSRKSKSPTVAKLAKKHSSRSPRHRSRSRKRSHSKKRSKSPRKTSRSSKKRSRSKDREKRRRSSSKSKKRSRSRDKKRSHSKEIKKRRSRSRDATSSSISKSSKSHHRSRSHKRSTSRSKASSTSSATKTSTRHRSKSDERHRSSKEKKTSKKRSKSKERTRHTSPAKTKSSSSSKEEKNNGEKVRTPAQKTSPLVKRDYDEEEKEIEKQENIINGKSPDQNYLKSPYGPNPPPNSHGKQKQTSNDQAAAMSTSSDDSSSSSDDDDEDDAMDAE